MLKQRLLDAVIIGTLGLGSFQAMPCRATPPAATQEDWGNTANHYLDQILDITHPVATLDRGTMSIPNYCDIILGGFAEMINIFERCDSYTGPVPQDQPYLTINGQPGCTHRALRELVAAAERRYGPNLKSEAGKSVALNHLLETAGKYGIKQGK